MNIIVKNSIANKDPFAQSDRGGFGANAGKGDSNRSMTRAFHENFPPTMGTAKVKGKFRKVY